MPEQRETRINTGVDTNKFFVGIAAEPFIVECFRYEANEKHEARASAR